MDPIDIVFRGDGEVEAIYSDDIADIAGHLGCVMKVTRASHVEPRPDGGWYADMGPVGGPKLEPFPTRQAALDAEVAWLKDNLGL